MVYLNQTGNLDATIKFETTLQPDDQLLIIVSSENLPIPANAGVDQSLYEIQKGDTLYSLSKKFSMSVDELREINNLADNALSVGQKIRTRKS